MVEGFAVLEIGQVPPEIDDFDVSLARSPQLIFLQNVDVFCDGLR